MKESERGKTPQHLNMELHEFYENQIRQLQKLIEFQDEVNLRLEQRADDLHRENIKNLVLICQLQEEQSQKK